MDQSSRICFLERRRNRCRKICYYDLDILSGSGDIRNQSRKLQKIDGNFACFWPLKFFRGGPQVVRPWPAIAARLRSCGKVSRRPMRYGCLKKKNITGRINKPVRNGCSGRPKQTVVCSMISDGMVGYYHACFVNITAYFSTQN